MRPLVCRVSPMLLLVSCVSCASCVPQLEVPPGARLACERDNDCPAGFVCDDDRELCVPEDGPCVDDDNAIDDGAPCTDDDGDDGICNDGFCVQSACGDAIVDPSREECDLGDNNADDVPGVCRSDCTLPRCGDGVIDVDEGCDDDNPHCDACDFVCPLGRTDCDGVGDCECVAVPVLDVSIDRVFAMAADEDALYIAATGDGIAPPLGVLRVPFDGGAVRKLAESVDIFETLFVAGDRVAFNDLGTLRDVPKDGGPADVRTLDDSIIDAAADLASGDIFTVDDESPCLRIAPNGDTFEIGPPIDAVSSVAVVNGEAFASTDLGDVGRVTPNGIEVLAENQFEIIGVYLESDGRALWWIDERGDLLRLVPDGAGAVVAARSPPSLLGARPYDLRIDARGFAWRAELSTGGFDDVVVTGVPPSGPRMRSRPNSVVDSIAISSRELCFSSFDLVICLPR